MGKSSQTSSKKDTISQYHHFIPQFILRNFAHPFNPPKIPRESTKRSKQKWSKGCYPGDPVLYTINLTGATAELVESPASHAFGVTDMYRDFADATNQQKLEQQLCRLESNAATIITKIRKEHEAGKAEVRLSRGDRDTLRKFLFIMKYRSSGFHRRYCHDTSDQYSEDDKAKLVRYMSEKGYQKPINIWFDNIKAILETRIDAGGKWMNDLRNRMYPDDAMWAIYHMQMMYLALCTPSSQNEEFLLTENVYSIHEGPVSLSIDVNTGKTVPGCYTEYHAFAIISPKLIMVLRSLLLPNPEEDSNDETRRWRENMYRMNTEQHNFPADANSILADLPIAKARNSYSTILDGRIELADGEDGSFRPHHKFYFRFFAISSDHVNKINCIMLDESYRISTIAFKSRLPARKTIEYYLSKPCKIKHPYIFKMIGDDPDDQRLLFLKKLEQIPKQLGSDITAEYHVLKPELQNEDQSKIFSEAIQKCPACGLSTSMKLYVKLGGSDLTMPEDLDQAKKMLNMRIKIDFWSQGTDESIRSEIRKNLRELFCQLPARRIWFYLKQIRQMVLGQRVRDATAEPQLELMEGPEDVIVQACQLFNPRGLCRTMYFATLNDIHRTKVLDLGVSVERRFDKNLARQIQAFAFGDSGSICDCAIEVVEKKARLYKDVVPPMNNPYQQLIPFWTEENNIEMATRILVQIDFHNLLKNSLPLSDLASLEHVIFRIIYPC